MAFGRPWKSSTWVLLADFYFPDRISKSTRGRWRVLFGRVPNFLPPLLGFTRVSGWILVKRTELGPPCGPCLGRKALPLSVRELLEQLWKALSLGASPLAEAWFRGGSCPRESVVWGHLSLPLDPSL